MSNNNKKPKIVFAPGSFDNFEGTQEELDQLVQQIKDMVESGELFRMAQAIDIQDIIDETDPLEIEEIVNEMTTPRKHH